MTLVELAFIPLILGFALGLWRWWAGLSMAITSIALVVAHILYVGAHANGIDCPDSTVITCGYGMVPNRLNIGGIAAQLSIWTVFSLAVALVGFAIGFRLRQRRREDRMLRQRPPRNARLVQQLPRRSPTAR